MSRLARQVLIAWLLALYGSVSLCGIGLHALLETGPSHHNHGPSEQKVVTISGVSTHCPLCEFQAQGQLPTVKSRLCAGRWSYATYRSTRRSPRVESNTLLPVPVLLRLPS